ncbi:MAG: hypothetical protein V1872_00695 [bacterium]
MKKEEERKVVKEAKDNSVEKIVKGLADIKLDVGKSLDTLEEKLVVQYKNLTGLEQAIDIENKNLENVYEIKINADSLAALLLAQKEKKTVFDVEIEQKKKNFETEMTEKKLRWEKEQTEFEATKKERDTQTKKERQREEEEYTYNLQLKRKKESDTYETKKAALEKELTEKKTSVEKALAERETAVLTKEKEFADLKTQVTTFPQRLEQAVKDAEKAVTGRLELAYKHGVELKAKEVDGEIKLYKQTIVALEAKIKEQDARIKELSQKSGEANQQVQNIAMKALDTSSTQRMFALNYEKKGNETPPQRNS